MSSSTTPVASCRCRYASAVEGPAGIDVSALLKETGYVTYDPGFVNTASCASAITYIDGDAGILRYRGYPIEQLAEKSSFLEVSYLLIYGELPTRGAAGGLQRPDPDAHAAARGHAPLLRRLPARRAPDGGALLGGERPVDVLPGQPRPVRPRPGRDLHGPAAGQGADDRVVRVQEVDRSAAALPGQLARVRRELPAHDVRRAGHRVRGRPGGRRRCSTCCSCCTPTTSRTAPRRPSGWSAPARPTCSPRSRPA